MKYTAIVPKCRKMPFIGNWKNMGIIFFLQFYYKCYWEKSDVLKIAFVITIKYFISSFFDAFIKF